MAVTMSKKDKDALAAAGAAWNAANAAGDKAAMEKAHADAEAIRANYGYSGGADGSQNIKLSSGSGGSKSSSSGNSQYSGYTPAGKGSDHYMQVMSASDQALLKSYGDAYNNAIAAGDQAAAMKAHEAAEALRGQYGYSGGGDGSEYIPLLQQIVGGGFNAGSRPTYSSEYSSRIDALLDQILNRDAFSYNAADDSLFQQYKTMYNREGDRAMQDTMAAAASQAGGMNSYAITAAQQANDYYSAQLADKVPELYQLAYEMYLDDIDLQVRDLGLLQDMDQTQYNRYRDTMSDWENDRNFAYQQYRDDVADGQWQTSFDRGMFESDRDYNYNVGRDEIEDERFEREWAYELALNQLKASSSGGSGSSRGSGGKSKPTLTAAQTLSALEDGIINETTKAAYEYYFGEPYDDDTDAEPIAEEGTEFTGSSGYNNVLATIDRAPGLTDYDKMNIIEDAYNNGRLTDEEADRLLDYIGVEA